MHSSYDCLYLFENQQISIFEIKRKDLPADAVKSDIYRWLLFTKNTLSITPFTFLALNTSDFSEERFFREGYLSFDSVQAVFIQESSSVQNILQAADVSELTAELGQAIIQWLALQAA